MSATDRCEGCAFTPGTEANLSPLTLTKARLCAMTLDPFYCHANLVDGQLPEGQERLCAGWADLMDGMHQRGEYAAMSEHKRAMLRAGLTALIKLEDRLLAGENADDFDMLAEVKALLEADPIWTAEPSEVAVR